MKRIAFHVNSSKPSAPDVRNRLAECAGKCGIAVVDAAASPDVVVVLGGDGTMLSAVHLYPGTPLLGLNLGSLGYLASVEEVNFDAAIAALAEGRYTISFRTALRTRGVNALNDVVVSRGVSGHAIRLAFSVDGEPVTRFVADGLVVATPTGSTAYSLSAGGPVLEPSLDCLCLTPICPHTLTSRPVIFRGDSVIRLSNILSKGTSVYVTADGRDVFALNEGDIISIKRSAHTTKLIRIKDSGFLGVLHAKLSENQ